MAQAKVKVTRTDDFIAFEVEGAGETILELPRLTKAVIERAVMHGLTQRVADTAASEKTPEGKLAAMKAMVDWLNAGNPWERERGAGPGSIELRAIAQVKGCSVEEIKKRIEETAKARGVKPAAIQAALVRTQDVQEALAALRAAAGKASGLDGDDLLAGM